MAFMKALKALLKSLSNQPGFTGLPEGKSQEYSFAGQDWALFFGFWQVLWVF